MSPEVRKPLLGAGASALAFCLLVACAYGWGPAERLDARTLTSLGQLGDRGQAPLPHTVAHAVDPVSLLILLGVLCIVGLAFRRPRHVAAAVAVVGLANVLSQVLKVVLAHPRVQPELRFGIEEAALPSGHATAAMSLVVAAILVVPKSLRLATAIGGAAFALIEGVAVVVLVWHYPSDVLAGFLIATGFGFLALAGVRWSEQRWPYREGSPTETWKGPARAGGAIGLAALAGFLIAVASARSEDLGVYLRDHTLGMAAAVAIAMVAASLAVWLALVTDE